MYKRQLPDSYQAVSGNSVSLPENAQYDMVAAAPDGNSIIVTAVINMSELDGENWSDEELAYYFKYIYRSDSDVIGASFNDLGFAKITLVQSEDGVADVYFRRCGSYVPVSYTHLDVYKRQLQYDAEGIGLFRTEFLFMDRNSMPTEDEQFEAYQKVAIAMNGKPVIIRTLDIGGDKEIPYMGLKKDENPFLGYRAIRFCLDRREDVYRPQLRALLRASAFGNIKIMVPMVTCLEEFREAKAMIEEVKAELDLKGIAYKRDIQVGIMVETAAASLMACLLYTSRCV